ncbi:MAG: hypothetical protein MK101_04710 [Phycisphaerales bacterium]|nr:hypothetical protein [Phycisphaerales bacterium]
MTFGLELWDLLRPSRRRKAKASKSAPPPRSRAMQDRYDALVVEMKQVWGLKVRKWRSSTSGVAWETHWRDGTISRMIESPYPRGPMSCAIFLHEVGHHAIGLSSIKPRCLEEKRAWDWALATMRERGFNVTDRVIKRRDDALRYAVAKSIRRKIRRIPLEMVPWIPPGVRLEPA